MMFQQFRNGMKCNFESAKSKKMGEIMFCSAWRLWFYVVSWSIWPNDHHISTSLDFSMFPSQTELLSTKKTTKNLCYWATKWHFIFMTWMSVVDPGCFGPSFLLVPCWSCQPATIWQKDIRRFDRTESGLEKKRNKHSRKYCTLHFRNKKHTSILQENNIKIQLETSGHL